MEPFDLFLKLRGLDLLSDASPWWWEEEPLFIIIGALLTQQTRWESVLESVANLKGASIDSLEKLVQSDIAPLIRKCNFSTRKARRLSLLAQNILKEYGTLEGFLEFGDGEFLLAQRGIGPESRDAILCYALKREVMVVDVYTKRLLSYLGLDFESYVDIQRYLMRGIEENLDAFKFGHFNPGALEYESLAQVYARFHGKIVEFSKRFSSAKEILDA